MDEPSNKTEMLAKYRKFSLIYDNVFRALENLVFRRDAENPRLALVRSVSKKSRLRVLDFCCGTGNGALAVAELSGEVVGIDLSPHMLSNADKKMRKRGIRNVTFREMDAARMEFDDESFDLATVSFGLHEMERPPSWEGRRTPEFEAARYRIGAQSLVCSRRVQYQRAWRAIRSKRPRRANTPQLRCLGLGPC